MSKIDGWHYYNHAAVPNCAPHETPNLGPINDKSIWNLQSEDGSKPLIVRYTTDFDFPNETHFWYVIKDGPFNFDELSKKYKKHVTKALERCSVRRLDPVADGGIIYDVYEAAFKSYKNADNEIPKLLFLDKIAHDSREYWGAFSNEGQLAGWMSCENHGDWVETMQGKYHPELQSYTRPSDALHYYLLNYYLNELGQKYLCSGSRNINHQTNVQEYKIKHWLFRKAYCKLHIEYNNKIKFAIKILFPFRKLLYYLDNITLVHQLNSLLKLEEIARADVNI